MLCTILFVVIACHRVEYIKTTNNQNIFTMTCCARTEKCKGKAPYVPAGTGDDGRHVCGSCYFPCLPGWDEK